MAGTPSGVLDGESKGSARDELTEVAGARPHRAASAMVRNIDCILGEKESHSEEEHDLTWILTELVGRIKEG